MDKGTKKIEFEAICENMSFDGKGCVHYKNHVGFIPSLLEGEKARIVMTYYTSNQFTGYVKELLSSSKDRVKPRCPVYDKCGGCSLLHMSYEAQLEFKKERVKQALQTIGGFKDIKVNNTLGMDNPYFYRNKIQMPLRLDKKRNIVSGFYQERTHNIIPINKCYIENEDADRILETIKKLMKSFKIQPYDEDKRTGVIRHILIRSSLHFDEIMVVLVTNCDSFPSRNNFVKELVKQEKKIVTVVQNINLRDTNVILGQKERILYGKGYIKDSICDVVFNISAMSFYQVNPIQVEKLYSLAIKKASLNKDELLLDAYCGIGTIGLIASKYVKEVHGIEIVKEAIEDAKNNARNNNIKNAKYYHGDAGEFILSQKEKGINYDVVIMDPARKGADNKFLSTLLNTKPKKIVYISCDPATLARDLKILSTEYTIEDVTPVDMFPQTFHVETVVLMSRKDK